MRSQFTFFRSFWEALKDLPDEDRLKCFDAIAAYALDEEEIPVEGIAKSILVLTKPTLDSSRKKAESGSAGASKREANRKQTASKPQANEKQRAREIEIEKEIEIDIEKENIKRKSFSPPTLEEVRAYCQERKNGIDPQRFIDYYAARGWELKQGQKVKDWQACVRTWERSTEKPKERPAASDADLKRMMGYLK